MDKQLASLLLKRISAIDTQTLHDTHIVLLPDFFLDHFLDITDATSIEAHIRRLAAQGGGNYPNVPQFVQQGGNAANTALGLARLGAQAHLICRTSPFGHHLLTYFLGQAGVDLSHVKTDGTLALTTALELGDHRANVMLGDPGSVADFSPDILTNPDYDCIQEADLVAVVNWNLNHFGTKLATDVFQYAHRHHVKTFFDTGDPSPKLTEIPTLLRDVLTTPLVDVFGLNENELRYYSGQTPTTQDELLTTARLLKQRIPARLDLHTSIFSCSLDGSCTVIPTEKFSSIIRATGAGDSWNAGNLLATLLGFPTGERLAFANLVAGLYISSTTTQPPTLDSISRYLKTQI
jgi:sugar/nucleoside kinase (ribokinase family)